MGTIFLQIVPITRVNLSAPVCRITVIVAGISFFTGLCPVPAGKAFYGIYR